MAQVGRVTFWGLHCTLSKCLAPTRRTQHPPQDESFTFLPTFPRKLLQPLFSCLVLGKAKVSPKHALTMPKLVMRCCTSRRGFLVLFFCAPVQTLPIRMSTSITRSRKKTKKFDPKSRPSQPRSWKTHLEVEHTLLPETLSLSCDHIC